MPGLVGIFSGKPMADGEAKLQRMLSTMRRESSDVVEAFCLPESGIYGGAVRRGDDSAGWRSGRAEHHGLVLCASGEVFDDGAASVAQNRSFFERFRQYGEASIQHLNGLFSGLLVNVLHKEAILFNDRFGLERIYIHESGDQVYFASEAKALLSVIPESRAFDPEGVKDFLTFGCTIENRTLFRQIRLLPGGSIWKFGSAGVRKTHYFDRSTWEQQPGLSAPAFEEEFEGTFKRVLPRYCQPGANLGISLTAGLDTRMIMACLPQAQAKPVCYTYEGPSGRTLDTRLAARVAQASGLRHHVLRLGPDFFTDFSDWVDKTVYATDGCSGVLGAHESYLTQMARELAPIRLTGVFGSEIFRGASTFKPRRLDTRLFSPVGGNAIAARAAEFATSSEHPVSFAAFHEVPWNLFGNFAACRARLAFRSPYLDNELVALSFRAPDSLRKSSGPALRLVQRNAPALGAIPTDMGVGGDAALRTMRRLWAKATFKLDYISNEGLPHWAASLDPLVDRLRARNMIFGHHKFLRYGSWFRTRVGDYIEGALSTVGGTGSELLDLEFVHGMARRHIEGHGSYLREIDAVLTLHTVDRLLLRQPSKATLPLAAR